MNQNRTERFDHLGESYEIRVTADQTGYFVRAFRDNEPLPVEYSVTFEKAADFHAGMAAVNELVKIAKNDVLLGHFKE